MGIGKKFQYSSKEMIALLTSLLEFNPHFRNSAAQCLENKIFDSIRRPNLEKPAPFKIHMPSDQEESYDYENAIDTYCCSIADYRELISYQIKKIHAQN